MSNFEVQVYTKFYSKAFDKIVLFPKTEHPEHFVHASTAPLAFCKRQSSPQDLLTLLCVQGSGYPVGQTMDLEEGVAAG